MEMRKPLIGVSICAVVLLVLGSLSNVVGYQSVQSSNQSAINNEVNQRELLFQTIVDIANNKEIQRVILKSQISRGIFPKSTIPDLDKNQLKHIYLVGLILSKIISKSKIHSMIQRYKMSNQVMQKEITIVIDKDATLNREITQLSNLNCDCENENATRLGFTIICSIIFILINPIAIIAGIFNELAFFHFQNNPILHSIFVIISGFTEVLMTILDLVGLFLNCWGPYT